MKFINGAYQRRRQLFLRLSRLGGGTLLLLLSLVAGTKDIGDPSQKKGIYIILPSAWSGDAALSLAVSDLSRHLASTQGRPLFAVKEGAVAKLPPNSIVLGGEESGWVAILRERGSLALPLLSEEGYFLKRLNYEGSPIIVVFAKSVVGGAYGLFRLGERWLLDPDSIFDSLEIAENPAFTFRLVSDPTDPDYPAPEQALRWGYNAIAVTDWPGLVLYDHLAPDIYDPQKHARERAWVEANRERARQRIAVAKKLYLKVVSSGDVLSFPRQVFDLYGREVGGELLCIALPKTQELLDYALREVLTDFPEIDVIMVRTGENYPQGPLTGNPPTQGCGEGYNHEGLSLAIETVYRRVVENGARTYIQRAWDLGDAGFHADPTVARKVMLGIPSSERISLSFKHTRTDFWRFNEVNPNIGKGDFPQVVEFQAAREYEGKGAFPNYLGEVFTLGGGEREPRGGVRYAYERGVRSIWVWAKGGGWGGPQLRSDVWIDVNVYALSRLAWEPAADPYTLALDWARLRFGPKAAPYVAAALLKSPEAVLKGLYVGPYARKNSSWAPNNLWVRDDGIYGGERLELFYRASQGGDDLAEALREKAQALAIVENMILDMEKASQLVTDGELAQRATNTLFYERSLFETLSHYLRGMFYYYRWLDSQRTDYGSRQLALESLKLWQEAWERHAMTADLPGVATPFQDRGMVDTIAAATKTLSSIP